MTKQPASSLQKPDRMTRVGLRAFLALILAATLSFPLAACTSDDGSSTPNDEQAQEQVNEPASSSSTPSNDQKAGGSSAKKQSAAKKKAEEKKASSTKKASSEKKNPQAKTVEKDGVVHTDSHDNIKLDTVPAYSGEPYVEVEDNKASFTKEEKKRGSFETYSPLDGLGRCGVAFALVGKEIMPTEKRGDIGSVKPTGWQTAKYSWVDGKYLYNRCHLIGYQLAGENANEKNLVTGTRQLNVQGMLPFENEVADYVDATGNHVLYRVTPVFKGKDLVSHGIRMEAYSVEDNGRGVDFDVYCYNVEDGVMIDYANGDNKADGTVSGEKLPTGGGIPKTTYKKSNSSSNAKSGSSDKKTVYILNTNTKKIHLKDCSAVSRMSDRNKESFNGTLAQAEKLGYDPCQMCNP